MYLRGGGRDDASKKKIGGGKSSSLLSRQARSGVKEKKVVSLEDIPDKFSPKWCTAIPILMHLTDPNGEIQDGERKRESVVGVLLVADKEVVEENGEITVTHISEHDVSVAELIVDACTSHLEHEVGNEVHRPRKSGRPTSSERTRSLSRMPLLSVDESESLVGSSRPDSRLSSVTRSTDYDAEYDRDDFGTQFSEMDMRDDMSEQGSVVSDGDSMSVISADQGF